MSKVTNVDEAIASIEYMKRNIASLERNKEGQILDSASRAQTFIHLATIVVVGLMVLFEFSTGHLITNTMINLNDDSYYRVLGAVVIGGFLAACLSIVYITVRKQAQRDGEELSQYIHRNISHLEYLGHGSDLLIKYIVFVALIFAGKPEWITPFLVVFTADYLIQGRFFLLKVRLRKISGLFLLAASGFFFWFEVEQVVWPLMIFFVFTVLSFLELKKKATVNE